MQVEKHKIRKSVEEETTYILAAHGAAQTSSLTVSGAERKADSWVPPPPRESNGASEFGRGWWGCAVYCWLKEPPI